MKTAKTRIRWQNDFGTLINSQLRALRCGRCSICCAFKTTAQSNGKFLARGLLSWRRHSTASTAAVEGEHALGSRTEEMPVTVAGAVTPRCPAIRHTAGLGDGFRVGCRGH